MKKTLWAGLAIGMMTLSIAEVATATTVINFNDLTTYSGNLYDISSYTKDGFILAPASGQFFMGTQPGSAYYNGSAALGSAFSNGVTNLSRTDGLAFNLDSMDIDILMHSQLITFTGKDKLGTTMATLSYNAPNLNWNTVSFDASFDNVYSVQWAQGTMDASDYHFFDNITVASTPVPLPGAVWLLGSGLAGLVGASRKKKV